MGGGARQGSGKGHRAAPCQWGYKRLGRFYGRLAAAAAGAHLTACAVIGGGWWGWKDEKLWLEALFANGELMVAPRDGFQRVYDLAHRVHPALLDMVLPHHAEVHATFVERAVQALGITQARWIHDYFRTKPRLKDVDLDILVQRGDVLRVQVEGWSLPAYVHRAHGGLLKKAQRGDLSATHTTLLSPFDPLVWGRERALGMFGFDYRIECYTPQERWQYGYFVFRKEQADADQYCF